MAGHTSRYVNRHISGLWLHHLRQVRAPRVTSVADARDALARAVGRQLLKPFDDRAVAAMLVNQAAQGVAAEPPALRAFDPDHVELTEQVGAPSGRRHDLEGIE